MFQKATRKKVKLKLAITGPSGSGKTYSALRLATGLTNNGRIALIDTENESASLYDGRFNFDTYNITRPFDNDKFIVGINEAVKAAYDLLIIDSGSHFWQGILEFKSKLDSRGGNSFANWDKAGAKFQDILDAILHSNIHIIVCLRSKMEYILEENVKGKTVPKKVGLAPIMRDGIEFEFTTVFDLAMDHTAQVSKDRTEMFDGKIFQITEDTGRLFQDWLSNKKPIDTESKIVAEQPVKETPVSTTLPPSPLEQLEDVLKGHEDKATAWMRANKWINAPETYKDAPIARITQVLAKPNVFIKTIGGTK